jgi:hypothetical protein
LSNKFRIAGQVTESSNMTKKIGEQLNALNSLANVTQNTFAAAMERAKMIQSDEQNIRQLAAEAAARAQAYAASGGGSGGGSAMDKMDADIKAHAARLRADDAIRIASNKAENNATFARMRVEGSNFMAKLNAAGSTVPYSGAPAGGGLTNSSLPWYTMPPQESGVNVPAAPPPNIPLGGSTGGGGSGGGSGGGGSGGGSGGGGSTGGSEGPQAGAPTPQTVAAKRAAANNQLSTAPIDTLWPQAKAAAAPLAKSVASTIGGWPVKAALAAKDTYKLVQKAAGGAFDWAYGNK